MEDAGLAQTSYEEERHCSVYLILEVLTINNNILRLGYQGCHVFVRSATAQCHEILGKDSNCTTGA